MTKRLAKERSEINRNLPQKQRCTERHRTHHALQAELHIRVEKHARAVATQAKQQEEQSRLLQQRTLKELQDNQEILIRQESEERKNIIQARFGQPDLHSATQRPPTSNPKWTKPDNIQDKTPRRSQSSTLPAYSKRQQLRHQIRAGLRVLLTFPTKQIKSLFGDGVT